MERYLGADVHAASVTFCVLDASLQLTRLRSVNASSEFASRCPPR